MSDEIQYSLSESGTSVHAVCRNQVVGEITFVRMGGNKVVIDYTSVVPEFRNRQIGLTLVRTVANMARANHHYIIALCPFARSMFNRYPEFDDVRLMRMH